MKIFKLEKNEKNEFEEEMKVKGEETYRTFNYDFSDISEE